MSETQLAEILAPAPARKILPFSRPSGAGALMLLSWAAPLAVLLAWEFSVRFFAIPPHILPSPSRVAQSFIKLAASGSLGADLLASLARAATGFAIGGAIGLTLGALVGFSKLAEALLDRSVQMARAIPFLALLPLSIVWFGVGEGQKIFLVALGVAFPIYINTVLGIRQVDPKFLELAQVQGLSPTETLRRIILPAAAPAILTSVRFALATAWLALVVAETVGAQSGLGFVAMDAREFLRTDVIVMVVVIYALIGVAADALVRLLERKILAWHPHYAKDGP